MSACMRRRKARHPDMDVPMSASQSDTDILDMRGERITEPGCKMARMRAKGRLKMEVQANCTRVGTVFYVNSFCIN